MPAEDVLKLNVGGCVFVTKRGTLCLEADSMLAKLFQDGSPYGPLPTTAEGEIFLDRDPRAFGYLLNYLRDGGRIVEVVPAKLLPRLAEDSDYFGLTKLFDYCRGRQKEIEQEQSHQVQSKQTGHVWAVGLEDLKNGRALYNGARLMPFKLSSHHEDGENDYAIIESPLV